MEWMVVPATVGLGLPFVFSLKTRSFQMW